MSSFTDATFQPLIGVRRQGRQVYKIFGAQGDGFWYDVGYIGSGFRVHVREGYETDLASDPTGLLQVWGIAEKGVKSFAIHDTLRENTLFTKLQSDAIFLMAMETEGMPALWRDAIFDIVRGNSSRLRHNPDDRVFDVVMPPH